MSGYVTDLVMRFRRMEAKRQQWDNWFQSLGEVFLPTQADFTRSNSQGRKRDYRNYENSHRVAARNFAATVAGLIGPQSADQLVVEPDDPDLAERDDVREWADTVRVRMWRALNRVSARYKQARAEVDNSLVVFGTGALFIGEDASATGLLFRSYHLRDVVVGTNASGEVDKLGFCRRLTAEQAAAEYGEERLGGKTREALSRNAPNQKDTRFEFLHLILPREDRDQRLIPSARNMAYASTVIDVESEHIVRESGFHEFPFAVPRWDTSPDECYGRSPAMLAYSDARTLQSIARTLLIGGQRAVDPPTWVMNDGVMSAVRMYPGGVTVFDAQSVQAIGGRPPAGVFDMGTNVPVGREMQNDYRLLVEASFFRDLFTSAVDSPQRTATEILERKEEMVRILGPTFGRLEEDYIGRIVERVFHLMERSGSFPERPGVLQNSRVTFSYFSPFQLARRATEAIGVSRSMELLAPLAQFDPSILDHYDTDAIARGTPEWFGFSQRYIRAADEVAERRAQRAQAQQMQEEVDMAGKGAMAVRDLALAEASVKE